MAEKYRKLDPKFWDDEKVQGLPATDKLIAVYCMTSPQCNRIGLYVMRSSLGCEHCGMDRETFAKRFGNVSQTLGWGFDSAVNVLYLPKWWRYNRPENPNVLKGCLLDVHDVPQTPLLEAFATNTAELPLPLQSVLVETFAKRYRNVTETFAKRMPHQEQEQEQEQDQQQEFVVVADPPAAQRAIDPVCELVNAFPSLIPGGMGRVGPVDRRNIEDILAMTGGVEPAKAVFLLVAEQKQSGKHITNAIKYARGIAEKQQTAKDLTANQTAKPEAKEGITWNNI